MDINEALRMLMWKEQFLLSAERSGVYSFCAKKNNEGKKRQNTHLTPHYILKALGQYPGLGHKEYNNSWVAKVQMLEIPSQQSANPCSTQILQTCQVFALFPGEWHTVLPLMCQEVFSPIHD